MAKTVALRNQETKLYEWVGTNSITGGSGSLIPLFSNSGVSSASANPYSDLPLDNIDSGTTDTTRVGNGITLKGLHLRFSIENEPSLITNVQVRLIVGWLDPNFGSVALANLFFLHTAAGNNVITAQLNGSTHNNTVFKKVLVDRVYTVHPGNQVTGGVALQQSMNRLVKLNIPLHNKKYRFKNSSAGQGGEHEDLWIFMTSFAPGQPNTQQLVNVRMTGRVYYKDG